MPEDPEQQAPGPRTARDSAAGVDLRSYDWRALIEQLPLAVYIDRLDESSSNIYTSPQLEAILGYTAEEWAADSDLLLKILHPDDRERVMAAHRHSSVTGEAFREEYRIMARDGRVVWFLDQATVVRDQRGQPALHHGFYLDISERKALELALAETAEQLREQTHYLESLLEISPVAIVTTDVDGTVTAWNPAAEGLFGYTRAEAVGHKIDDLVASCPEVRAEALAVTRDTVLGGLVHAVTRRMHRDGSLIDVELLSAPVLVGGDPVGTYAIYHDIRELQRRKQYLESLLELSQTAIVTMDLDAVVTSWNPAAEKLFGYTRDEAIGRGVDDLVARSDAIRAEAIDVSKQAGKGQLVRLSTRRTRKDGTLVDVDVRAAPIFVGEQRVGMYALYDELTELLRARHEAEAAAEAKSAFLATMSHEIRTPLNAVIGMTELLLETDLAPAQRELADVVHTSGDALLGVINEILDFSKLEAGGVRLERHPFALRDSVETALEMVAASAAEKDLDVACLVDPDAPVAIVGDWTRLRQILVNLLTNAVKFTQQGEVVLTVESHITAESAHDYRLQFTVRDTGIGIAADRLDAVFESFSQVDASTTRRYGGTGLGLAISKRLCELMGGEMWVESEPGSGSAFHFTLPADGAPSPEAEPIAVELRGMRILVVDDNATNREVVVRQARSWGMIPRETGLPREALEWVRRGDPVDIAILDMQMPGMDGLALAREMRRYRDADALPLVLLSSLGRRGDDRELNAEFAAVLTKPIKSSQLYNVIAAVVGVQTAGAPARESEQAVERSARPLLRILVAEDNAVNQRLTLLLLEKLGCAADVVANGVEALDALERGPYDVILMDVEMPEMDGREATRRILRTWSSDERPRIIAMTASAMPGDREACLAAGMDDYLTKPVQLDELRQALERCTSYADGVLDPEAFEKLRLRTGDADFTAELVDVFLHDAPPLLEALRGALEEAEAEHARRAAHTLKSNAELFGATRLAELCRELEATARSGSLGGTAELAAGIDAEYARVDAALRQRLPAT
jgi:PAS domain S-box-containing protein